MGILTARDDAQMKLADDNAAEGDLLILVLRNTSRQAADPESSVLCEVMGRDESGRLVLAPVSTYETWDRAKEAALRMSGARQGESESLVM